MGPGVFSFTIFATLSPSSRILIVPKSFESVFRLNHFREARFCHLFQGRAQTANILSKFLLFCGQPLHCPKKLHDCFNIQLKTKGA